MYSAINLILCFSLYKHKMDLFKTLIELNNKIELEKIASKKYNYDPDESDEDEDEKEFVLESRERFINNYNKRNNRQFKIKKYKFKDIK
jgi:hypothetical protein